MKTLDRAKIEINKIRDKVDEGFGGGARLDEIAAKLMIQLRTIPAVDRSGRAFGFVGADGEPPTFRRELSQQLRNTGIRPALDRRMGGIIIEEIGDGTVIRRHASRGERSAQQHRDAVADHQNGPDFV